MRTQPREVLIYDQAEACPYLPGKTARMPLRLPLAMLTPAEFDARLAAGDRRSGQLLYTTVCPGCQACEPIRLDVARFVPSRTQERIWKRGAQAFRTVVQPPVIDDSRVQLFNLHRRERDLAHDREDIDLAGYEQFLADSCCDTVEIAYFAEERLVAVAMLDRGAQAMSAVYTYFDPAFSRFSPGAYSVLKQIDLCRTWQKQYLYLGYYVAGSRHMAYKATYRPHERRIGGRWQAFP